MINKTASEMTYTVSSGALNSTPTALDTVKARKLAYYDHTMRKQGSCLVKGKGSPYSITERKIPELIPVLGIPPAGDVSHKPGGRMPLLSARPAVTLATLKRASTSFAAW